MRIFSILVTLFCVSASLSKVHAADKPNIIVVFIDDMGYSDFSCFGGTVETQHVDRLAAEGIRFTNFYVNSPICSPSRVALTTGQYPHRWRITSFLNNRRGNTKRGMAQWTWVDFSVRVVKKGVVRVAGMVGAKVVHRMATRLQMGDERVVAHMD